MKKCKTIFILLRILLCCVAFSLYIFPIEKIRVYVKSIKIYVCKLTSCTRNLWNVGKFPHFKTNARNEFNRTSEQNKRRQRRGDEEKIDSFNNTLFSVK